MVPGDGEGFFGIVEGVQRVISVEIVLFELLHDHKLEHIKHDKEREEDVSDEEESRVIVVAWNISVDEHEHLPVFAS